MKLCTFLVDRSYTEKDEAGQLGGMVFEEQFMSKGNCSRQRGKGYNFGTRGRSTVGVQEDFMWQAGA